MESQRIKSTLKRLHEDLDQTDRVDPELKSLLVEIDQDIHRLLDPEDEEVSEADGIIERLGDLASDFKAHYPRTGKFLRDLADSLGKMGM